MLIGVILCPKLNLASLCIDSFPSSFPSFISMHSDQPKDHSNFAVGHRPFDFHNHSHGRVGQVAGMFVVGRAAGDLVGVGVAHNLEAHTVVDLVVGVLVGRSFARMKFGWEAERQVGA